MAKKTVATLQTGSKKLSKAIKMVKSQKTGAYIFQEKILNKDGVIIVHRHKREDDEFSKNFRILDEKKYGISKIIFGNLN